MYNTIRTVRIFFLGNACIAALILSIDVINLKRTMTRIPACCTCMGFVVVLWVLCGRPGFFRVAGHCRIVAVAVALFGYNIFADDWSASMSGIRERAAVIMYDSSPFSVDAMRVRIICPCSS